MKANRTGIVVLIFLVVALFGCSNAKPGSNEINELKRPEELIELRKESQNFMFYCAESDMECLDDLAQAVEKSYMKITSDLQANLDFKIKIYIYKNIQTFHKAIGRIDAPDWVVGTADGNDIKMVSPLNPGKVHNYQSLMQVIVHEFTHVVVNNIVPSGEKIPLWLNEGIATYEAKQTYLLDGIQKAIRSGKIPTLDSLDTYNSQKFGDAGGYQFSYTLAEYIISEYGFEKLNDFIRSSSDYISVFEVNKDEFEQNWKTYLETKYKH